MKLNFRSAGNSFWDTGLFSKLPYIFGYETWSLAKVPEVVHILSFYPRGSKSSLFPSTCSSFRAMGVIFKIVIFGYETCPWQKIQKLQIYCLSTPRDQNWAHFSLWAVVSEIRTNFSKLPYLGKKLGHCPKLKLDLIFTLWAAVYKIWVDFQNCHSWAWNLGMNMTFPKSRCSDST